MKIRSSAFAVASCLVAMAAVTVMAPSAEASGSSPRPYMPPQSHGVTPALSLGSGNLTYHGGHVESGVVTNYVIYWGVPSQPLPAPAYDVDPYAAHVDEFLHDVSCCASPAIAGILGQYVGGLSITYGGSYFDTTGYSPNSTVTDAQIQAEVRKAESAMGWSGGIGHNFFVLTGPDEQICASFGCSDTDFCGYHETMSDNGGAETAYEAIPYEEDAGCQTELAEVSAEGATDPLSNDAVNVVSHELFETITDPGVGFGDYGWYDGAGFEIGDKCAWLFGPIVATAGGGDITTSAGYDYTIQEEYSNAASDCRMS